MQVKAARSAGAGFRDYFIIRAGNAQYDERRGAGAAARFS